VNTYFPNSQRGLARLAYKLQYDAEFERWIGLIRKHKPVVICGDFNVAHEEIDIARPKENERNAGFTIEERSWMTRFLFEGYIDTCRMFNRYEGNYSWWSFMFNARNKNIGWRIDYVIISEVLSRNVVRSVIFANIMSSDHAPVELVLSFR